MFLFSWSKTWVKSPHRSNHSVILANCMAGAEPKCSACFKMHKGFGLEHTAYFFPPKAICTPRSTSQAQSYKGVTLVLLHKYWYGSAGLSNDQLLCVVINNSGLYVFKACGSDSSFLHGYTFFYDKFNSHCFISGMFGYLLFSHTSGQVYLALPV